ncbi:MAG: hypothetical protein LBI89_02365 [Prevotellaceae bacterium]|jgi:hypothetical protein|nr:hypothetical protein [Prevotellaceae bacterium]
MKTFLEIHERYRAPGMDTRHVRHAQVVSLLDKLPAPFTVAPVGRSAENRAIYGIQAGNGATRVLLWSQMHGDESTATRTLFDVFSFLAASDEYDDMRRGILSQLSLLFIPMLNPDGAERCRRENAWGIDINRDALSTTTPEGKILHSQIQAFQPFFSFNLHDQESYFSAGVSRIPATIAFLAPPPDAQESLTDSRRRAIQLIVALDRKLQPVIPNGVAKWDDTFEPRAFGEWTQAQNSAAILIESGGYYNDPERNFVRRLHFGILLEALRAVAFESYTTEPVAPYFAIPRNRENGLFDTLRRRQTLTANGVSYTTDIGVRKGETFAGDFDFFGALTDDDGARLTPDACNP